MSFQLILHPHGKTENRLCHNCNCMQASYSYWDKERDLTHLTCVRCKTVLQTPIYTKAMQAKTIKLETEKKNVLLNEETWRKLEVAVFQLCKYYTKRPGGYWRVADLFTVMHFYMKMYVNYSLLGDHNELIDQKLKTCKGPYINRTTQVTQPVLSLIHEIQRREISQSAGVYRRAALGVIEMVLESDDTEFCSSIGEILNLT